MNTTFASCLSSAYVGKEQEEKAFVQEVQGAYMFHSMESPGLPDSYGQTAKKHTPLWEFTTSFHTTPLLRAHTHTASKACGCSLCGPPSKQRPQWLHTAQPISRVCEKELVGEYPHLLGQSINKYLFKVTLLLISSHRNTFISRKGILSLNLVWQEETTVCM